MRIMKYGIAAILILFLLAGCVTTPVQVTTPTSVSATSPTEPTFPRPNDEPLDLTEPEPYDQGEISVSCSLLPETVDNPENLPVLKWITFCTSYPDDTSIYVSYNRTTQWSEEAADEVNAMLAAYDMPFRIQFMIFTTDYEKRIIDVDWFRVPEVRAAMAEADLITGPFTEAEAINYLMPITEYISEDAEISLSGMVAHELSWELAAYDDEVYGLPIGRVCPVTNGWYVREEVFTEYGFTIEDFQKDFSSMGEVFAELYEKTGNIGFLNMNDGNGWASTQRGGVTVIWPGRMHRIIDNRYDCIGLCYAIDYSGDKPVVVNYLETDYFAQVSEYMFEYVQYGYKNGYAADYLVSYGSCYSVYPARFYEETHDGMEGGYIWLIPVEDTSVSLGFSGNMTGILKKSDQQELALQLLETMGEDATFSEQLLFGQEGKDYEVVDGWYQPLSRQDGTYNMRFLSGMSAFYGAIYDDYITQDFILPETEEMTRLEAYQSSVEQSQIWAPVEFNWSKMGTEYKQIERVLRDRLQFLPYVSDDNFEMLLETVREAGGERIKRELQRQLDEWFAENPEWLELCISNKTEN